MAFASRFSFDKKKTIESLKTDKITLESEKAKLEQENKKLKKSKKIAIKPKSSLTQVKATDRLAILKKELDDLNADILKKEQTIQTISQDALTSQNEIQLLRTNNATLTARVSTLEYTDKANSGLNIRLKALNEILQEVKIDKENAVQTAKEANEDAIFTGNKNVYLLNEIKKLKQKIRGLIINPETTQETPKTNKEDNKIQQLTKELEIAKKKNTVCESELEENTTENIEKFNKIKKLTDKNAQLIDQNSLLEEEKKQITKIAGYIDNTTNFHTLQN